MGHIIEAGPQHLPHLIKLAAVSHEQGNVGRIGEFNYGLVSEMFYNAIQSDDALVLCSNGGVMAGEAFTLSTGDLAARELIWFAMDGTGVRMWDMFELWCKDKGVKYVVASDNLAHPKAGKVSKFFGKRGFTPLKLDLIKEL